MASFTETFADGARIIDVRVFCDLSSHALCFVGDPTTTTGVFTEYLNKSNRLDNGSGQRLNRKTTRPVTPKELVVEAYETLLGERPPEGLTVFNVWKICAERLQADPPKAVVIENLHLAQGPSAAYQMRAFFIQDAPCPLLLSYATNELCPSTRRRNTMTVSP